MKWNQMKFTWNFNSASVFLSWQIFFTPFHSVISTFYYFILPFECNRKSTVRLEFYFIFALLASIRSRIFHIFFCSFHWFFFPCRLYVKRITRSSNADISRLTQRLHIIKSQSKYRFNKVCACVWVVCIAFLGEVWFLIGKIVYQKFLLKGGSEPTHIDAQRWIIRCNLSIDFFLLGIAAAAAAVGNGVCCLCCLFFFVTLS